MASECQHTPRPTLYLEWQAWAHEMSKTHRQVKCPHCGLWAIWRPKRLFARSKRNDERSVSRREAGAYGASDVADRGCLTALCADAAPDQSHARDLDDSGGGGHL